MAKKITLKKPVEAKEPVSVSDKTLKPVASEDPSEIKHVITEKLDRESGAVTRAEIREVKGLPPTETSPTPPARGLPIGTSTEDIKKGETGTIKTPPETPVTAPAAAESSSTPREPAKTETTDPAPATTPAAADKIPYTDACELLSERGGCRASAGCIHRDLSCEAKRPPTEEELQPRTAVVSTNMIHSGTPGQHIIIGNPGVLIPPAPYSGPQQTGNLAKTNHITSDPHAVKKGN